MKLRTAARKVVNHVLRDVGDVHVVIGPLVWQPSDGTSPRRWYFSIATADKDKIFRIDQIVIGSDKPHEEKSAILTALTHCGPIVIHDTDDELYMAKLCEMLWPGERVTELRKAVEAERAQG